MENNVDVPHLNNTVNSTEAVENVELQQVNMSLRRRSPFNDHSKKHLTSITKTMKKHPRLESTAKVSSERTSPFLSSWALKRLKTQLIVAKSEITDLEIKVAHEKTKQKEMQINFDKEKELLIDQVKKSEDAVGDVKNHIETIKRREKELLADLEQALIDQRESKMKWLKEKIELQKNIADLKDQLLEANVDYKNQICEMKKDMDELLQGLQGAQSEVELLKEQLSKQTNKVAKCIELEVKLKKQTTELQQFTSTLAKLEYNKEIYKCWEQHDKLSQKRLSNMAYLETEVHQLRTTEKSLRDTISNTLVLEEQINLLKSKLKVMQPIEKEFHEAKIQLARLEHALEQWESAGRMHGIKSARELSSVLNNALSTQLNTVEKLSNLQAQLAELKEEITTVKFERDKAVEKVNDLLAVRKSHENLIMRLKKHLPLVTRERDNYRDQLESYEKEMSVILSEGSEAGCSALLTTRINQLETNLQEYRDLLAANELQTNTKTLDDFQAEASKWREEAKSARCEMEKLRMQRDQLQAHVEKLATVDADTATEVPHLADNSKAAECHQDRMEEESGQQEIEGPQVVLLEDAAGACSEDLQQLRQQLENSRIKLKSMEEVSASIAQEYKEVCFMLLGYTIDKIGHKNYKISNVYAESTEDYLTFSFCDDTIEMMHTDYSATLSDLVELHINQHRSIPVFLSAVTMDLFNKTAMHQDVDH